MSRQGTLDDGTPSGEIAVAEVRPPRIARALLSLTLPSGFVRESVLGDFHEEFVARRRESWWAARAWFWREALGVARRSLWRRMRRQHVSDIGDGTRGGEPPRPPRWRRVVSRLDTVATSDIPYSVRNLAKAPGFTAVAVLSLGLGIAPLAVLGGFANAMFLRPLEHVAEQHRLVALFRGGGGPLSWPNLADAAEQTTALTGIAAVSVSDGFNLTEGEETRPIMAAEVSANYFEVLGVGAAEGRVFAAQEMGAVADPVVVISDGFRRHHFGGDEALGEVLRIDGRDHVVIGVAPGGLLSPEIPVEPDLYVPLSPLVVEERGRRGLAGIGRLAPGADLDDARAQLDMVTARLAEQYPGYWPASGEMSRFEAHPLRALRIRPGQEAGIAAAFGMVTFIGLLVLFTACANLGNLLLARGWQRHGEIAVRLALGADRASLVSMLLIEGVLLACAGGALGTLGAHWLTQLLRSGVVVPGVHLDLTVDTRVLAFAGAISAATGVLFGLVPALRSSRPEITAALKGDSAAAGPGRALSFRNVMVAGQVATSLALLISAAVLLRSLWVMNAVDPGFEPHGVVTLTVDLGQRSYSAVEGRQFFEDLVERAAQVPGVSAAAVSVDLPLDGSRWRTVVHPEGFANPDEPFRMADENRVTPGYFEVMRMSMLRGRTFAEADSGANEVVVNEAFERTYWPGGALGRSVWIGEHASGGTERLEQIGAPQRADTAAVVVGVVRDAKYESLGETPARARVWRLYPRNYAPRAHLVVRTGAGMGVTMSTLRRLVRESDADLPVLAPRPMADIVRDSNLEQRIASAVMAMIGAVALLLALVGIYGVVSFLVSRRTREVGLRVALGARRADVVVLVVGQGMRLVIVGAAVGVMLALGIAQALAAVFPGVQALDLVAPAAATTLLCAAAALATLAPALRASRVDPMVALRGD